MGVGGILLPEPVDLGVDWLEGWILDGGVLVRLVDTPKPMKRFPVRGKRY
jgi:hypothetical protein